MKLRVLGKPASAGSKTILPTKAGPRVVDGGSAPAREHRATWRQDIIEHARRALDAGAVPFAKGTPVALSVTFYMKRPTSHTKAEQAVIAPVVMPDSTKLLRAVEDALTVAEVWHDDAQVTDTLVRRRYATDAEPVGALIEIEVAGWHQLTLPTS
jgi:Holliday junction resolvase RusA-like endonuclease